jgi:hypothetical protein
MYFAERETRMEFERPVRHLEKDTVWFRVPLQTPHSIEGAFPTNTVALQAARTLLLQSLLRSKGLFATPPTLPQLGSLVSSWTLPETPFRWSSTPPTGSYSVALTAVWISRSQIVPEWAPASFSEGIELDLFHPDLEEVEEIAGDSEGLVHLRNLEEVRAEASAEVSRLWKLARTATEAAEVAEEAFFQKYGESFSDDSE